MIALFSTLVVHGHSSRIMFKNQANIYEWLPGDGRRSRANALGARMTVGNDEEPGESRETRILLDTEDLTIPNIVSASLVVPIVSGNPEHAAFILCRVMERWGYGKANASDATVGAPAQEGDVTWRYPVFNANDPATPYWKDGMFGGYFEEAECISGNVTSESVSFQFGNPAKVFKWFSEGFGCVVMKNGSLVETCGPLEMCSPYIDITVPSTGPSVLLIVGVSLGAAVVVGLLVAAFFVFRRRVDYMPIHDLGSAIDENATMLLKDWKEVLQESGIDLIKEEDLEWGDVIGRGSCGDVHVAQLGSKIVAVKSINERGRQNLIMSSESLLSEIVMMKQLKHPYIAEILGIMIGDGRREQIKIVMPYASNGSLESALARDPPFSKDTMLKIALQIALAMQHLHETTPPVLHRDIKPKNILLTEDNTAWLTDFGISRVLGGEKDLTMMGTQGYIAPEILRSGVENYTEKTDIYSYGILLLDMETDGSRVYSGDLWMTNKLNVPECTLKLLIEDCVSEDLARRPTASEVVDELRGLGAVDK